LTRYFLFLITGLLLAMSTWSVIVLAQSDSLNAEGNDSLVTRIDSVEAAFFPEQIDFNSVPTVRQDLRTAPFPGGWFFLINCGLLLLLGFKFLFFPQYSRKAWNALVNENLFFQFVREKSPVNLPVVIIETVLKLYIVSFTSLMFLMLIIPGLIPGPGKLAQLFLFFASFYAAKSLISFLLAVLTDNVEFYKVQNLSNVIISANAAWVLVPLILLVMYSAEPFRQYGIYLVLIVFVVAVIVLIYRTIRIVSKTRMSVNLQFFLYLCAFEILPDLFMVKVFESSFV